MISTKTNTGKLPLPERKYKGGVSAPTPVMVATLNAATIAAGETIGDVPDFMDRKKHPELNAPARAKTGTVAALAARIQDPAKRAAVEKVDAEKAAKRAAVDASGGKAALRAAAKKAVEEAKVPVTKVPTGVKAKDATKTARPAKKVVEARKKAPAVAKQPRVTSYDWDGAKLKAKTGTIPPTPPFASYGPHMKKAHDMAKAGQAKELREYLAGFSHDPCPPSRKNLFRYGELCLAALKGAAAGGTGKDA